MAGPALAAAAWPVRTKMPAPMMAPTPRATMLKAESVRFRGTPPWVVSAWDLGFLGFGFQVAIDFLTKMFAIRCLAFAIGVDQAPKRRVSE